MNDTPRQPTPEHHTVIGSAILIWTCIAAVAILAITALWMGQNQKPVEEKRSGGDHTTEIRHDIEDSRPTLSDLEDPADPALLTPETGDPLGPLPDNREALLFDYVTNSYNVPENPDCQAKFHLAAATETLPYYDPTNTIALELPYNPWWGTDQYVLNSFDLVFVDLGSSIVDQVMFGPLYVREPRKGCFWVRPYDLTTLPARSFEDIQKDAASQPLKPLQEPTETTLGDKHVVTSVYQGINCHTLYLDVLGETYNYSFAARCVTEESAPHHLEYLQEIVKEMEFIE